MYEVIYKFTSSTSHAGTDASTFVGNLLDENTCISSAEDLH